MSIITSPQFTLMIGGVGFLLALLNPQVGIAFLLGTLYFNGVFPSVPIGTLEFSASTPIIVGLYLKALSLKKSDPKNRLLGWQSALLVGLGVAFFSPSFSVIRRMLRFA